MIDVDLKVMKEWIPNYAYNVAFTYVHINHASTVN